jgi:nitrite reductase/ring-hydroxylating ferredoxin subunit
MADGCGVGCSSRRAFLSQISGVALAALAGSTVFAADAVYPVTEVDGVEISPSVKSFPIPAADGVSIDKGSGVILVRYQGKVIAFNLACPHENTALRWKQGNGKFECPKHNSRYTPEGKFIDGRATRNMDRLPVKRDGNNVIVDLSDMIKSDRKPAEWAAAAIAV